MSNPVKTDSAATPQQNQSGNGDALVRPGLEGVVAFETEIAEPDRDGGALRYRGVDIEELAGRVSFGDVWSLLVDGRFGNGLRPATDAPLPLRTGDVRVDVQSALAALAPAHDFRPLLDTDDEQARDQLARTSELALSHVAQSARGDRPAVPQSELDRCSTVTERFLTRWRGEPDPAHVKALDAYWVSAAEHGLNASTFTARVIASTGADVAATLSGAVGAMSGPLHGGAPARVLPMVAEVESAGDARRVVESILDRGERLMGFGHRVYRAEDPRARVLRETCRQLAAPRFEVAAELEQAALSVLAERRPDRPIATNVEFWAAMILDFAEVPTPMMPAMFTCARTAGWCAHVLEQKRTGRLIRPSAHYVGPGPRSVGQVEGWNSVSPLDAVVT
ncbi:citrate synthase [Saccharopolyspora lacisalsi]|uniref:citrate synthase (unknown stereospecificity) n=1 Tax=Halosaccharopolyspora lacisalsi TaxID=1000566 RepID=A0A839DZ30_9PSEU|nr:citrate synthase 2 [Halosaccharopolyspora lacisalsi]MBA8826754.1 citrate synthase [Halosaccharopolyspora lacisalsi]